MSAANCLPRFDQKSALLIFGKSSILEEGRRLLDELGHLTEVVTKVEEAFSILYQGRYDMILIDLDAQQSGGIVLSARTWGTRPDIPIIVLSDWREASTQKNVDGVWFMPKPCTADQLSEVVRTALGNNGA